MSRLRQGLLLAAGLIAVSGLTLASAVAWGPHSCGVVIVKVIGCAIGSYESLSGGLLAADAAIFAGWLAWSAVQVQIATEERRATASRVEVEDILALDIDAKAEGLGRIWRILEEMDNDTEARKYGIEKRESMIEGVRWGIDKIASQGWIDSARSMARELGWQRRRHFEELFTEFEELRATMHQSPIDSSELLRKVGSVGDWMSVVQPEVEQYFEGRFRRSGKAWTLGYAIGIHAGVDFDE
ncbi:hypothetical protein [Bradyrhizobium sp. SZCCHNRI3052]|uniref:hypothetical protein n=1 Tax=Bradyrhizobium sp. SZCCHNRI3052 TaxID=3057295 RepID=UPI002915C6BB|nr:hypothetical protein [Bradyrhizobium sp. SZCCHNRI3052]